MTVTDPQPTPIGLPELESHLWEAANILRGSPVDRTDWKSYILPLLFFKRICDVWDEEHTAMLAEYGEDFADEHRFQVPDDCHWQKVRKAPRNVGTALANAMRGVEAANQKHLYGVFGDAQWTNKDRLPDELLKDLVEHFSSLSLGNARVASDVMGDAYEYLIKQFADSTNKKAGEFYTPRSVVRLMVDIIDPKERPRDQVIFAETLMDAETPAVYRDAAERALAAAEGDEELQRWLFCARHKVLTRCGDTDAASKLMADYRKSDVGRVDLNNDAWYLIVQPATMGRFATLALAQATTLAEQEGERLHYGNKDTVALAWFVNGNFAKAAELQAEATKAARNDPVYVGRLTRYEATISAAAQRATDEQAGQRGK